MIVLLDSRTAPASNAFISMKQFWIKLAKGLILLVLLIGAIRLLAGEDDWMCQNGQWIKHGQPSAPMPTRPCVAK